MHTQNLRKGIILGSHRAHRQLKLEGTRKAPSFLSLARAFFVCPCLTLVVVMKLVQSDLSPAFQVGQLDLVSQWVSTRNPSQLHPPSLTNFKVTLGYLIKGQFFTGLLHPMKAVTMIGFICLWFPRMFLVDKVSHQRVWTSWHIVPCLTRIVFSNHHLLSKQDT